MNIKLIKKQTLFLVLLFTIILLIIITSPFVYIHIKNQQYNRTDSSSDYLNKNYVFYNGGEKAEEFFDEFVADKEYIDISFKYRDNDNAIRLYDTSRTIFVLDVKYNKNEYDFLFNEIYYKTNKPDITNDGNYYGDFFITSITQNDPVYMENYCGVFFNGNDGVIRYVFINNVNSINIIKSGSELEYINKSVDISWNFD